MTTKKPAAEKAAGVRIVHSSGASRADERALLAHLPHITVIAAGVVTNRPGLPFHAHILFHHPGPQWGNAADQSTVSADELTASIACSHKHHDLLLALIRDHYTPRRRPGAHPDLFKHSFMTTMHWLCTKKRARAMEAARACDLAMLDNEVPRLGEETNAHFRRARALKKMYERWKRGEGYNPMRKAKEKAGTDPWEILSRVRM